MTEKLFTGNDPNTSKMEFLVLKEDYITLLQHHKIEDVLKSETLHAPGRMPDIEKEPRPENPVVLYTAEDNAPAALAKTRTNQWLKAEQYIAARQKN